jgi:hypothetical protein
MQHASLRVFVSSRGYLRIRESLRILGPRQYFLALDDQKARVFGGDGSGFGRSTHALALNEEN